MWKFLKILIIIVAIVAGLWYFFVKFLGVSYQTLGIAALGLGLILGVAWLAIKGMINERR